MYLGSDEFNNAIENTQGNAPKIRVTLANGEILSNIKSMKYYGGSNNSDDISIGTTNMARIDVTVLTDKMLTNNEIFLEQGVELANGVVEYMPIGYFVAQKPQGDIDEVKFTAYDRMQKFEKPYSSSLTYPTTSALILDELCQICGVELATPIDNAIEVTENLKGYTCREVLGYIASMHSSFACIDRYGKLNLRWYSDTPIEKKLNRIWSFEKSQENFEIAKVEIAKDSETNYVSGDGITTLYNSNPLATQEITDDVFAKLGGFSYSVGEIEMLDDARLDVWDMVSVTYYDGKTYNIPCMTLEHDFKAYSTTVKSVGKSESENEYRFTGPTIQYLNRMATELLVANRVIATKVDAEYVSSHAITTDNLDAIKADIQTLVVDEIDGKYATIDFANIDVANINKTNIGLLFAEVGLLDRATIVGGHVTGFLDAVEVNANKITAGTLIADRILLSGGDKGILYALNNLGELTSTNVDSLDGYVLTDRTINADKIIAESITANELDVNQIFGNEAVLNKLVSQQIFSDAVSTNIVVVGANATAKNALDLATSTGLSTGNQILIIDGAESEIIDFKAYGRSTQDGIPTPDIPVDIVSVGENGTLDIKITGKNLFDETLRFGRTAVGITTNVNSKKNGVINGTLTQNSSILNWHTTAPIDILGLSVGQSLTISYKRVSGTYTPNNTNTNAKFYCDLLDENKTAINKYQLFVCTLNNNEGKVIFTMTQQMKDDNVSYLYPQIWAYLNDKFDNLEIQIQVEHGTNVTEYEPHKESSISIPLTEPLRSVGDVRDEIACVDGIWGVIRKIGTSIFDGVNNKCNAVGTGGLNHPYGISFTSSNGYNDIDNKAVKIVSGNHRDLISDYFSRDKVVYYADTTTQDLGSGIYRTANGVWLSITRKIADDNNITSVDAFNTWLKNNNVDVQYVLAEEVFEPFDDQELIRIRLYNNTTYITNSDNAEMWVEYYKNNLTGIQLANMNGIGQSNNRLLANWASDNDITLIDGGKIYTRSILANSLAIGDFTNLAVANPDDYNPNGYATIEDDNGFKWFEFGSDDKLGYYSIVLNEFPIATTFNKGDQYLLRCLVYASQPTSIRICLRGHYEASGYINLASAFYDNVTTEQQFIEIPFKVNSLPNAKITRYSLFFETRNTKLGILYVREISVHQMTNGVLIANGSITANKIDVNDLFAQEITATGTITGATIIGSIFENDWDEASHTGLSIKSDLIRIGHKTSGQQAYYPYMEIGQGRINLTHYPRGVQDLPFVNISPYGIQAGIQKADMRVNTTLDFSADTGGMTLSGNFVAGKITTVAGADLDSIDKTVSHPLREYCDCSLFAQAIIDSYVSDVSIYGAQSMAMANINGTDYVLVLFTTSTTANNADVAVLYTLDGQVVRYKTGLKLGHCNGVTFNTKDSQFYVACAGGDNGINQVAVLTSELKIPKTYNLAGKEVQGIYGIAYNKDRETFYVVGSENSIAEVSTDFSTVLQKSTLQVKNDEYAPQSIFYDGTYISFTYNVDGSSYCDLYEPEDLSFVSMQFINNFGELEGGYYHKDELYLLVNTSNSGLILKSSQYLDGKVFDFWNERHLSDRIQTSDTIHELYFNSTATNFLLDGTIDKPFRKLYLGWSYMVGQSLKNIRMNLIGDFSKYNINIKKYLGTLYITGYNKTTAKIGGIYFRNFGNVRLSYLSVTKQNDSESSLISLYYGQECYMDYVSFDGAGTETYLLRVMGGTCETKHCYFNSNATYSIYANFYAVVTCESSNTYKGTGTMQTYNRAAISLAYRTPMATLVEAYKNEVIIGGSSYGTIDLAKITREGKYRVEGASTVTNCPTVLSTGQFCVDIVRYDYCIEYNVITYRGIPYKGVLGENSTEIKWYSLTAL